MAPSPGDRPDPTLVADPPRARPRRRSRLVHHVLAAAARRWGSVEKEVLGLAELVGRGDVCLDIGAEFGLYTHVLADLVGPTGAVHAFEPQRGAHRALRAGVRAAGLDWVHLHREALGDSPGTSVLSVPRRRGLPVHGRAFVVAGAHDEGPNREFHGQRDEPVTVTTLDRVVEGIGPRRIALLKADVEGAEGALLDGGAHTLALARGHRPHLLLEIEDRHTRKYGVTADEVFHRLTSQLGFRARTWSTTSGWQEVTAVSEAERNYLFSPG